MIDIEILNELNAGTPRDRLAALKETVKRAEFPPRDPRYINNHIHTTYSFSPYSPTAAAYAARAAGLATAGVIDHDSIAGAREFKTACEILDLPATIGLEARISMRGTGFEDRLTDNPDQRGISYMTFQGVPQAHIDEMQAFFAPYRALRDLRNREMTRRIDHLMAPYGIHVDYERDVLPLSMAKEGGGVTERHLMMALAKAMTARVKGEALIRELTGLNLALSKKQRDMLLDTDYPFYEYDLLGILKSAFVPRIFVPATEECPELKDAVALAKRCDCVLCYAYLGDVGESPTGDKKAQKFEDEYLDELMAALYDHGVRAVTYMPPRNTRAQLDRLRELCQRFGMFQVSGEDVNSPRQEFVCKAMEDPQFENLIESTWALIRHEAGMEHDPLETVIHG